MANDGAYNIRRCESELFLHAIYDDVWTHNTVVVWTLNSVDWQTL